MKPHRGLALTAALFAIAVSLSNANRNDEAQADARRAPLKDPPLAARAHPRRRGAVLRRHCGRAARRRGRRARRPASVRTTSSRAGRAGNLPPRSRSRSMRPRRRQALRRAVALGCVIRGETIHFDIVADKSARALMDLGGDARGFPLGNGILTVDTDAQAWARARRQRAEQGRRRRARRAGDDADQAAAGKGRA